MKWFLLLALVFPLLIACDDSEPTPVAKVRFLHSVSDQGDLELLVDTEVVAILSNGVMSEAIEIEPGLHKRIALRARGASVTLAEKTLDLEAQGYFVAFIGMVQDASLEVFIADAVVPELNNGEAAVEVASFYSEEFSFDVYVGNTLIQSDLGYAQTPAFTTLMSGVGLIKIHNAGDDPNTSIPVGSLEYTFESKSANLILLQRGNTGSLDIQVLPL